MMLTHKYGYWSEAPQRGNVLVLTRRGQDSSH